MTSTSKTDPRADQALIGSVINGYRLTRLIGRGGMGSVFGAELAIFNNTSGAANQIAVKVLHERLAVADPATVDRFINEARSTIRINHPGLVKVLDFGYLQSGSAYIMMEFLAGELLAERLRKRGPLPLLDACRIGRQIAEALGAAHDAGVVHRDLKPDNVMILPEESSEGQSAEASGGERVKVLDFGLAKIVAATAQETMPGYKTATGILLGTPKYMSPEQCRATGGKIDDRTDVYSLAVVLFEMLAGRPPFQAKAPGELIAMHILEPAPRIDGFVKGVPQVLVDLFVCMLNKTPEARPSMREVLNVLSSLIEGLPTVASLADGLPTVALSASSFPEVPSAPASTPRVSKPPASKPQVSKPPASKPPVRAQREPQRGLAMAALLSAGVLVACIGAFAAWRLGPTRGFRAPPVKSSPALRPAVLAPPSRAAAPPAVAAPAPAPVPVPAPISAPAPAPAPAPAAAPILAPREPAQPAPSVRRSSGERQRNKPARSRSSESGGSRAPNDTPVF